MKTRSNPSQDFRNIEVPQESMEAMARQIRALTSVAKLRKRRVVVSAAAAVALIVAAGWNVMLPHSEVAKIAEVRHTQSTPADSVVLTPEPTLPPLATAIVKPVKPRKRMPENTFASDDIPVETPKQPEETDMTQECPVMIYESGKLVACGSLENLPEITEIFNEVMGTVDGSQQVLSSGVETIDETVRIIRK